MTNKIQILAPWHNTMWHHTSVEKDGFIYYYV